jgi:hypothetical protein
MQSTSDGGFVRTQTFSDLMVADDTVTPVPLLVVGAGLLLAIAIIHLQDQGGLLGGESPTWLRYGYYLIEIGSIISALVLIRGKAIGWVLGLASSAAPLVGYLLSRTVGVPGDPGDVGNWGYLLGTVSLMVEASFIVLAVVCLIRLHRAGRGVADPDHQVTGASVVGGVTFGVAPQGQARYSKP